MLSGKTSAEPTVPEQSAKPIARWNSSRDCWEGEGIDLLSGLLDVFSETFPISGMTVNGVAYELPTLAHHTNDSGSLSSQRGGLIPTPRASDGEKGGPNQRGSKGDLTVSSAVALLPTATAQDAAASGGSSESNVTLTDAVVRTEFGTKPNARLLKTPTAQLAVNGGSQHPDKRKAGGHGPTLADEVEHLLPTPAASDSTGGRVSSEMGGVRESGSKRSVTLATAVHHELLPTPKAGDADFGMPRTSGRPPEKSTHLMTRLAYTLPVGPDLCERCGHDDLVHDADGFCASCSPQDCRDIQHGENLLPTPRATRGGSNTEIAYLAGGERSDEHRTQGVVEVPEGAQWGPYAAAIQRWELALGRPAPDPTEAGPKGGRRLSARFVEWLMGLPLGWLTDPEIGLSRTEQLRALGNGVVERQALYALQLMTKGNHVHY